MKSCDVTVVGEIYIDHVMSGFDTWPEPGSEVVTDHYAREVGGGAAITACALGRLGKNTSLVGVIGDDDARWLMNRLGDFGIGVQGLLTMPGPTGVTLSVSTQEDRSFFTHLGVNRQLASILFDREILMSLTRARHVHFAMPLARDVAARILPMLSDAGCTVSLDVGYQPLWLQDAGNDATRQAVDYLLPNEKEAALLSGGESAEAYFAFAQRTRIRNAVLKLGARGAMSHVDGATWSVSPPKVTAVDTTGSGDAFDAGFVDALLEEESMEDCLRRACICGALSTRVAGALNGLPTRDELWSTYEQTYRS